MQKDAGQRDAILLHDGVVGATRKKLLLERSWAEFSEAEEPVDSCGDDRERDTVDALGLIEARVDLFEDTDCEREARARGAMVQSLDAGADLAREPAWHGCWHDARLKHHGLDGGGVRADRGGRVALAGWVVCHEHHPEGVGRVREVAVADVVGVRERDPLRPGRASGRLRGLAEAVAQGGLDCGCESNVGTDRGVVPEGRAAGVRSRKRCA